MQVNKRNRLIIVLGMLFITTSIFVMSYADFVHYLSVPFTKEEINQLQNTDVNAVVIYPIFTQYAYESNGFYDYYNKKCGIECLTVRLDPNSIKPTYSVGESGYERLKQLNYTIITDIDVDRNPKILDAYDKVILLHNEYMTMTEFTAIKNHANVLYLYPNAMYAEIQYTQNNQTIKLIRGHSYPQINITNGFGYVTTSQHEYDYKCDDYKWRTRPNGLGLTCYPELLLTHDREIFKQIKAFPNLKATYNGL